ncbi:hypothetical protein V6N13_057386 [Hibiscus sabdariffa]
MPSGCGVPSLIVSSAPRPNLSVVWFFDWWVWMLLLVRNGHVSGEMVVCLGRLRASCIELWSRTTLQCPPLVAVEPKGCDRDPVLLKKLVVGPRGGSAGPPHGEHRSARPYCRRCAPGLNWPGRSSGAVTLKKLECSKQAYACIH